MHHGDKPRAEGGIWGDACGQLCRAGGGIGASDLWGAGGLVHVRST